MVAGIKKRNLVVQVILMVVTFGIYGIYWFYSTAQELKSAYGDTKASPALWTVLLFLPPVSIYSMYKYSELYEKWSPGHFSRWLLFVLWLVFAPAVWFIVQTELNRAEPMTGPMPAKGSATAGG